MIGNVIIIIIIFVITEIRQTKPTIKFEIKTSLISSSCKFILIKPNKLEVVAPAIEFNAMSIIQLSLSTEDWLAVY